MRINKNGWVARLAREEGYWIPDECTLFKAFTLALLKRAFKYTLRIGGLVLAVVTVVLSAAMWYVEGNIYADGFSGVLLDMMVDANPWFGIPMAIILFVVNFSIPVFAMLMAMALSGCAVVFGLHLAIVWSMNLPSELTPAEPPEWYQVLKTGVSNKLNKLCRPVEFYDDKET